MSFARLARQVGNTRSRIWGLSALHVPPRSAMCNSYTLRSVHGTITNMILDLLIEDRQYARHARLVRSGYITENEIKGVKVFENETFGAVDAAQWPVESAASSDLPYLLISL